MLIGKFTLVTVALLFSLPMTAQAGDIYVEVGDVINTSVDNVISVESGQVRVNIDSNKQFRVNTPQNQKLRNCSRRTRSRRANCRQTRTVIRTSPNTSTNTIVVDKVPKSSSSRVQSTQRLNCRGDGSHNSQQISQTNNSGEIVVQSSISTNGCR
ncbi:hypothetical protein Cri9333_4004 [Crinalium epipsammum PCC 9333]|uniref:Uncharacterized protein n=1 Tax=Crinalium epipsammum PCC 9333 TaxID=1173022 RepID=K9W3M6_9CYAN|nr:hypothetical protein [Crinalium epipsammum]AFZ14811.1 hypothetical protein Cri9333_4004 [Crinalium epipsammum PCC 9333]